eukprot:12745380-Alexandrium_andersonii.AAC.1
MEFRFAMAPEPALAMRPAMFTLLVEPLQLVTEVKLYSKEFLKHGSGILLLAWRRLLTLRVTLPRAAASSA